MKKIAVIGSRNFRGKKLLFSILEKYEISVLVSGGARGADTLAEIYADKNFIPKLIFKPDYERFGKRAAPVIRNREIIDNSDLVIAFWDKISPGTKSALEYAQKKCKEVVVIYTKTKKEINFSNL